MRRSTNLSRLGVAILLIIAGFCCSFVPKVSNANNAGTLVVDGGNPYPVPPANSGVVLVDGGNPYPVPPS
jgi:hypothetical protein